MRNWAINLVTCFAASIDLSNSEPRDLPQTFFCSLGDLCISAALTNLERRIWGRKPLISSCSASRVRTKTTLPSFDPADENT